MQEHQFFSLNGMTFEGNKLGEGELNIKENGNVGLGTTNPNSILHIDSSEFVFQVTHPSTIEEKRPQYFSIDGLTFEKGRKEENEHMRISSSCVCFPISTHCTYSFCGIK